MELVKRTNREADHPLLRWFNHERQTWVALVLLGIGAGIFFGEWNVNQRYVDQKVAPVVAQKAEVQKQLKVLATKVVPQLKAEVKCQKTRADLATAAAIGAGADPASLHGCPLIAR